MDDKNGESLEQRGENDGMNIMVKGLFINASN